MTTKKVLEAAVVAALTAFAATASAQQVCQPGNGYTGAGNGSANVTTTWGAITAVPSVNFQTRTKVKGTCQVKDVIFSTNLRPRNQFFAVAGGETNMNGDKCSLYKMAASVHGMLGRGDLYDAHTEATQIVASVDSLVSTGGLSASDAAPIRSAAVAVVDCITVNLP